MFNPLSITSVITKDIENQTKGRTGFYAKSKN